MFSFKQKSWTIFDGSLSWVGYECGHVFDIKIWTESAAQCKHTPAHTIEWLFQLFVENSA